MSSEYEYIVADLLVKETKRLQELQKNAEKNKLEIEELTNRLSTTQSLFENYNMSISGSSKSGACWDLSGKLA